MLITHRLSQRFRLSKWRQMRSTVSAGNDGSQVMSTPLPESEIRHIGPIFRRFVHLSARLWVHARMEMMHPSMGIINLFLPPRVLAPIRGEKVLDMCAAPGGKAAHVSELMGGEGQVCSLHIFLGL